MIFTKQFSKRMRLALYCGLPGALILIFSFFPLAQQTAFAAARTPFNPKQPLSGGGFSFIQTTTKSNTRGDYTIINNSLLNNNPTAVVLAAPALIPNNLTQPIPFDRVNVGVEYNDQLQSWTVVNEDGSDMPSGVRFNVQGTIEQLPQDGAFSLPVEASDLTSNGRVVIGNTFGSDNPDAQIVVTPEIYAPNPARDSQNLSVSYDARLGQWVLAHEDGNPINPGEIYNVLMWPQSSTRVASTISTNAYGALACLDNSVANNNPAATPIATIKATTGVKLTDPIGLLYDSFDARWCVFDMSIAPLPSNAQFVISNL